MVNELKKRKLKGFVLPTLYLLITISVFVGVILLGKSSEFKERNYQYSVDVIDDNVSSVIMEDTVTSSVIASPVDDSNVSATIHFYSKDSTEEEQKNSLIYYKNTYMPNTGVLYTADNAFEVKNVFQGKVSEILDDEFFGKYVVVEHTNTLRTYYYGLDNIAVNVGDELSTGTIIGTSKNNEITTSKQSFLLEVYHNNELINPEKFIGTKITDYN